MRINIILLASLLSLTAMAQDGDGEREAFNAARREGTVEAYNRFLAEYPRGYYTEQARLNRDNEVVKLYCRPEATLDLLVDYIEINQPHAPRIRTFYSNLVNQPTHSYRVLSHHLGFNGTTGTVHETVTDTDGFKNINVFCFDERGLLTADTITDGGVTVIRTYTYAYDNLHGYTLAAVTRESAGERLTYRLAAEYDNDDRVTRLNGGKLNYRMEYNELGSITAMTAKSGNATEIVSFNDGTPIVIDCYNTPGGDKKVKLSYDYNSDYGKRYLTSLREHPKSGDAVATSLQYTLDDRGRYVTVTATDAGGTTLYTISRTYTD